MRKTLNEKIEEAIKQIGIIPEPATIDFELLRKRRGQPGWFEAQGYIAMRGILVSFLGDHTWMTRDQVLGAIQSGIDRAILDYNRRRALHKAIRRRHGSNGRKKV